MHINDVGTVEQYFECTTKIKQFVSSASSEMITLCSVT